MSDWESNQEICYFREYLQIPSVHPNPNYDKCITFLKKQAATIDAAVRVFYPVNESNPMLIMTIIGEEPEIPAILLHSHMDVVPVFEEKWTHAPFAAEVDRDGKIYARGAQDMKSVGMQYLGALRELKKEDLKFKRTIHISFGSDEEMGGRLGMQPFVQTSDFKALNIGFSLDEGYASETEELPVFYAERSVWRLSFNIMGQSGHGSLLLENTPGAKLRIILDKMFDMREIELQRLKNNDDISIGDVTTINLTKISGGVQSNVVPPQMGAFFDIRLAIDVDHKEFEENLSKICEEAGGGIDIVFEHKKPKVTPTKIDDSNPFWVAFKHATDKMGLKVKPYVFPGGTDSRFIRQMGIPALGFSPMNNTKLLLHDHDEYIQVDTYLKGIKIYKEIIAHLANA